MGLYSSTFGLLQVGASRPEYLNVIRMTQIDAESLKSIAKQVASAFRAPQLAFATAA